MLNPVLNSNRSRLVYFIIWVILIVTHIFFIRFFFNFSFLIAITDSLVFNLIYMLFGLWIWFIVKYNDFELKNLINLIAGHSLAGFIVTGFWISLASLIAENMVDDPAYDRFLNNSLPGRILIGVFYYLVIILVYYLIIYYRDFQDRIQKEAALESRYREAELNALKAQINPHFIYNSLNSISSLTVTEPSKAQEMIVKLSDFFRLSLKNTSDQFTTLDKEIEYSLNYLEIEKIRFGDKINFSVHISDEVKKFRVPHLLLQPLLENTIKHGVQQSVSPVEIILKAEKKEKYIEMMISNHFDTEMEIGQSGIGLKNVSERLKLIYKRSDLIQTEIENSIFKVNIKIPVYQ